MEIPFRQDAVLNKADHTALRILIKFLRHVPDFPIYSNGTKPGTLQSLPHQRTVMDWWLYLHTEVPDDPVKIARDQRWGQDALSTATDLITHDTTATTNGIGAPAEYDTAIDTSYQHNLGIQKGWIK